MGMVIGDVLVDRDRIRAMCAELGGRISSDYAGKDVLLVGVLTGAFVFLSDLMRHISIPVSVDFVAVSSYNHGTDSSGVVRILRDLDTNVEGRHVILVEDIIDTGLTLQSLRELLRTRNPASLAICTAFDKPERRRAPIHVEYVGMIIPDRFIVGYGLDFAGRYRNLPDVRILKNENEGGIPCL